METFIDWLQIELNRRNWSHADLARRSKVSEAHISRIMSKTRKPGLEALSSIAKALRISEDEVFRRAGLLTPKRIGSDDLERFGDFLTTLASLPSEDQQLIFQLVERIKTSEILVSQ